MESNTVLSKIIKDVIDAYPDDANHQLLHFFSQVSNGTHDQASADDKEIFMECWGRCILKAKAFGGRGKTSSIAFRSDLLTELIRSSKDASTIIDLIDIYSKNCAIERINSSTLRVISSTGVQLLAALEDSYRWPQTESGTGDFCHDEFVMAQKQRIRGGKQTWIISDKSIENQFSSYCPVNNHFLGILNCIHGHMELKQTKRISKDGVQDLLPKSFLTSETLYIIGVRIENKRGAVIHQQRAWAIYRFLSDATAVCGCCSIFPYPAGVDKSPFEVSGEGEVMFTYECHGMQPISKMLDGHFAVFLRKHPHVILMWCRQLSTLLSTLLQNDVNVIHRPHLKDLYVRKDGLLALGNVAVSKTLGESSVCEGIRISVEKFVSSFLSSSLCLSRGHEVDMRSKVGVESNGEETVVIVEGCILRINFTYGPQNALKISLDLDDKHEVVRDEGCVSVTIFDESNVAVVDASSHVLCMRAVNTGQVLLTATRMHVAGSSVETPRRLRIVVIRPPPVESVQVIELASLLEETYSTNRAVFRVAKCLQRPVGHSPCVSAEERHLLSRQWEPMSNMRPQHSLGRLRSNGPD